jgi:hypothetical protein
MKSQNQFEARPMELAVSGHFLSTSERIEQGLSRMTFSGLSINETRFRKGQIEIGARHFGADHGEE